MNYTLQLRRSSINDVTLYRIIYLDVKFWIRRCWWVLISYERDVICGRPMYLSFVTSRSPNRLRFGWRFGKSKLVLTFQQKICVVLEKYKKGLQDFNRTLTFCLIFCLFIARLRRTRKKCWKQKNIWRVG